MKISGSPRIKFTQCLVWFAENFYSGRGFMSLYYNIGGKYFLMKHKKIHLLMTRAYSLYRKNAGVDRLFVTNDSISHEGGNV